MADGDSQSCKNGKVDVGPEDRGVAAIKPQYLTTKDQFHEFIDSANKEDTEETISSEPGNDAGENNENSDVSVEPKAKKIKLDGTLGDLADQSEANEEEKPEKKRMRGQNKSRPHVKFSQLEQQRLCPSITQECASKCFFGDKCKYLHDAEKYLLGKQEDIGPKCYLYETFGKCIYGITCRFAKSHLGEDFKNLINHDLVKQWQDIVVVRNSLDKNLQQQLRKKKVSFEKAEKYLKLLSKSQKNRNLESKAQANPEPRDDSTPCATTQDDNIAVPADKTINTSEISTETPAQVNPKENARVTLGAVTDEDVIRLRPCEKKTKGPTRDNLL